MEISMDPVAFTIGSAEIRWYGIMIGLGVLILVSWTIWQVKKDQFLSSDGYTQG